MKQVIDGLLYDTDKAEEIANYSNGLGHSDFCNLDESLYVTKKGKYFLAGDGGARTKYAEQCGSMTGGSSGIQTMSKQEALRWLESYQIDADIVNKYFSDLIEDA